MFTGAVTKSSHQERRDGDCAQVAVGPNNNGQANLVFTDEAANGTSLVNNESTYNATQTLNASVRSSSSLSPPVSCKIPRKQGDWVSTVAVQCWTTRTSRHHRPVRPGPQNRSGLIRDDSGRSNGRANLVFTDEAANGTSLVNNESTVRAASMRTVQDPKAIGSAVAVQCGTDLHHRPKLQTKRPSDSSLRWNGPTSLEIVSPASATIVSRVGTHFARPLQRRRRSGPALTSLE